jgi:signal transduction histidine kinase
MGQEIEVQSEPGRGARFTFTLDRADRPAGKTQGGDA